MNKKFWNWKNKKVKNQKTQEETTQRTLFLNGTIAEESWFDDDVTPQLFKDELNSGSGDITVWINSPGGDCVAAAQIYNMLMDYKGNVTVKIDGIAASAASVIAMAGSKVLVSPVSMLMIHNPATIAFGDTAEMEKTIDMLNQVKESIINAYEIKTGMSRAKISHLMDAETWMDAHKAIELGFVDEMMKRNALPDEEEDEEDDITALKDDEEEPETESKDDEDEDKKNPVPSKNSMLFSQKTVINNLKNKVNKSKHKSVSADSLMDRLNLIKNWR